MLLLLPETLQEWLPGGHLAYFISDAVDGLDLSDFHGRYDKDGPRNQPFHPAMMAKVLVYGYATGGWPIEFVRSINCGIIRCNI